MKLEKKRRITMLVSLTFSPKLFLKQEKFYLSICEEKFNSIKSLPNLDSLIISHFKKPKKMEIIKIRKSHVKKYQETNTTLN